MSPRAGPGAGRAAAPHVCAQCPKAFRRLCDLNKHAKSHSRPYKCPVPGCKYTTLGWPTAKELERHHNDKHSPSPRTYACAFRPCTYVSKRESNCKQHMEKAHNWVYVRTRSKGKRSATAQHRADNGCDDGPKEHGASVEPHHDPASDVSASPPSPPPLVLPPDADFVLYDNDQPDAMVADGDSMFPPYGSSQGPDSYLPWSSPTTRLRKNESFIAMFTQAYNGSLDKAYPLVNNSGDIQVDPMLLDQAHLSTRNPRQPEPRDVAADGAPMKAESPVTMAHASFPAAKRKYETTQISSAAPGQPSSGGQAASTSSGSNAASRRGDDRNDGNQYPNKRPKPNPVEDFDDTSMPDIFRYAHPNIYDENQTGKYSSCHTLHRDISTLVRHLSRPAHRLEVTDRFISSFHVPDPTFRHQKAGLCRRCWQTFRDEASFDAHVSRPCQKVSKGKREKWWALYTSFTPLADATDIAARPHAAPAEHAGGLSGHFGNSPVGDTEDHVRDEMGIPSTSVPSHIPGQATAAASIPSTPAGPRLVPADELQKLQREHEALRERHQQLEQMTQVLFARQLIQETMGQAAAARSVGVAQPQGARPNRPVAPATAGRDDLVQHMDSQSTNVDVHGFMKEVDITGQSLSRTSSGLSAASTSTSTTIHRVAPSPPPRSAELPSAGPNYHHYQHQHQQSEDTHLTAWRPRRPPTSIPDSGYGTEAFHCGGGLCNILAAPPTALVTPSSSLEGPGGGSGNDGRAGKMTESAPIGNRQQEGMGEGAPSAQTPKITATAAASPTPTPTPAPTPPASQPQPQPQQQQQLGFLDDQEMADYDESYRLFYEETSSYLPERSPQLDFDLDFEMAID